MKRLFILYLLLSLLGLLIAVMMQITGSKNLTIQLLLVINAFIAVNYYEKIKTK
jgi:ABC-type Mn2+/Zn2+ transport system permease subunit